MMAGSNASHSGAYRATMMALLTAAYGLNLFDRQIINMLSESIKKDLVLSDAQLGLMLGAMFALLYSFAALPIARYADRANRVHVVGAAILAWSFFTAGCGMAANFLQLLVMRVGVGIGEAGCAPPSQSLIADTYPIEKRAKALGIFGLGSPVGAASGLALGGVLGELVGWRWTLILAGIPGIIIGLMILGFLKDQPAKEKAAPPPLFPQLRLLFAKKSFIFLMFGIVLLSFPNVSTMAFSTPFYMRVHAADLAALGAPLGLGPLAVLGLGMGLFGATGGALGTIFGGYWADKLGMRDVRWYAWIPAIGSVFVVFSYYLMFLVPSGGLSLVLFLLPSFFCNVWNGPGTLALQNLAGPQMRATVMAVVLFVQSVLALGLGPLTVGLISDHFTPIYGPGEAVRIGILSVLLICFFSALSHWLASRTLEKDLAEV
jgi:MFS family permease